MCAHFCEFLSRISNNIKCRCILMPVHLVWGQFFFGDFLFHLKPIFIQIFRWRYIWMRMGSVWLAVYFNTVIYEPQHCLSKMISSFGQALNISIMGKVLAYGWWYWTRRILFVHRKCVYFGNKTNRRRRR